MPELTCEYCGDKFTVPSCREDTAKFCSKTCAGKSRSESAEVTRQCEVCGTNFKIKKHRLNAQENAGKYCSEECHNESMRERVKTECECCGTEIEKVPSKLKGVENTYCSKKCKYEHAREDVNCANCGSEFTLPKSRTIQTMNHYCSEECRQRRINVECNNPDCDEVFEKYQSNYDLYDKHYCSQDCHYEAKREGSYYECTVCGEEVYRTPAENTEQVFCSTECFTRYNVGENHQRYSKTVVACWNCGEKMDRAKNRIKRNKRHFCDVQCMGEWTKWAGKEPNDPDPDKDVPRWAWRKGEDVVEKFKRLNESTIVYTDI